MEDRRSAVLDAALLTFARHGYRRTSMEEVARSAQISRPGLYFLFSSKESLFRAAATQALERDVATAARVLGEDDRPLADRVLEAFDAWAGRYTGPLTRDVAMVVEENPALLGAVVETAPARFAALLEQALAAEADAGTAARVAQTLISTSVGIKHQVGSRDDYRDRMRVAVDLLVR